MNSRLTIGACVLLLAIAVGLQVRMGSGLLPSELGSWDPPAQYTTGVMVHDYLTSALGSNPVKFAESFYVRFPKVAFGQWPPMYFAIQAAWYLIFPISPASARALSAVIALTIASTLFLRLRRSSGLIAACAGAAVFLSFQKIQLAAWEVMSDLLTGLFVFLAVLSFSDFLKEPRRRRNAWYFALWASAALLTKGSAFPLAPFALVAPLLAWRPRCFGTVSYWLAGIACAIVSAPFYVFIAHLGFGYSLNAPAEGPDPNFSKLNALSMLGRAAPVFVWIVAMAGFAAAVYYRWRGGEDDSATNDALLAGTFILLQVLCLLAFPLTQDPRVYILSLAPAALLAGYCARRIQWVLRSRPVFSTAAPAVLALLCIATCGAAPVPHIEGYQEALDLIPYRPEGCLILVAGSAPCEGVMIVDRLTHDRLRSGVVLRASHFLAEASWGGQHYSPLSSDVGEVAKYLMDLPVRYILLDDTRPMPYYLVLDQTVRAYPQNFALLGRFPIHSSGRLLGEVRVYENLAAGDRRPEVVRVRLGLERGARTLEYRWK